MFIVIESIDGGGKGKQREEIAKFMQNREFNVKHTDFPDHTTVIWEHFLHPALHGEITLHPGAWFSGFALEKFLWQDELKKYQGDSKNLFIADGYYTTTLVYQCLIQKMPSLEFGVKFAEEFDLAKPDLVIYLDVTPKTAMARKAVEEGKDEKDMFESDIQKQEELRAAFKQMVKDQVWCKWKEIDGNGTIEEVRDLIIQEIQEFIV